MAARADGVEGVTFVDLYAEYPRMKINIDREQERLLAHDVVVLQFPLMWYSTPSLLKEWQDLVLEYGFAYGEGGTALAGKSMLLAVTVGGPETAYSETGYNRFALRSLLRPLEQTAALCGFKFLPPYCLFSALKERTEIALDAHVEGYPRLLAGLARDEITTESLGTRDLLDAEFVATLTKGTS